MESQDQDFIKGFNVGYQLSKHDPTLLSLLTKSKNNDSEYFKAIILGAKEHDREKLLEQIKKAQEQNKGKERGDR